MALGQRPAEIGVSAAMIEAFGETIFRLSHNIQRRLGDPVREKDFAAIDRQRSDLGLSDGEIAERIGLTAAQVIHIRNVMEWRHYRTESYRYLHELGGGRRFRVERQLRTEDRMSQAQSAKALREAMRFSPASTGRYIEAGWWRNDTLSGWLAEHKSSRADAVALVDGDGTITYGVLAESVERLAGAMYRLGLRKGDVVAIQLPNLAEYVICYLAICHIGAVMTTLYMPHRRQEMVTLLGHSRARMLICLSEVGDFKPAETALGLAEDLPELAHIVALGAPVSGALSLADLLSDSAVSAGDVPVAADPCLLLYTSGTTASPKGVPHNAHTLLSNVRTSVPEHGIMTEDILFSAAPFGHLFGLYSIHLALAVGATQYLLPSFTPPALVEGLVESQASVLFAAPAHIAACLNAGLFEGRDLAALKLAILAGAAVPGGLARAFDSLLANGTVSQLWGMTETQAGLYTRPSDGIDLAAASAGRPSPGTEVRIVDEAGNEVAADDEGELQVRGPLLFPGYYQNDAANGEALTEDGWFRSGDLARSDKDGNIAIVGRCKEIINRGGIKYNPRDVEELIDGHPGIQQSAIVPVPDSVLGERACVYVVPSGSAELTLDEICAYLEDKGIAKVKWPERLEIVQEMPMTPTRKVIKGRLRPA